MKIALHSDKSIKEIQKEFQEVFPFLNIQFFVKTHEEGKPSHKEDMIPNEKKLGEISNVNSTVEIDSQFTTAELEKLFEEQFGLYIQVFRKSGNVWIETSRTDDWTLAFQNEEGRKSTEKIADEQLDLTDRDKWE